VVSSQGTALTEHQMRLLKKHAPRIILALDADEAGDAATLRGLNVARDALDRETEIRFDPRGLVRTEGRLGADIRVMTLPEGADPDDVINRDPDEWRRLVEAAEPVVAYVMRVLTTGRDLDDPKVKTEVAATVLPLIEDVAQPIERDTYRQRLARLLRVDERALTVRPSGRAGRGPRREPAEAAPEAAGEAPAAGERQATREVSKLEAYCLGALLRQPDLLYKADRELQAQGLPKLAADDFLAVEHQLIFNALTTALEQVDLEPVEYVESELDPSLAPRLRALLAEETPPEAAGRRDVAGPTAERTAEALMMGVLRLRKRTIANWLHELRFLAEDAREQGDVRAETLQQEIQTQAQALAGVDRALARRGKRGEALGVRVGLR
jgi:DNA primase